MTQKVTTMADHQIIQPPLDLKEKAKPRASSQLNFDPIAKAEQALNRLSGNFTIWIEEEVDKLISTWKTAQETGMSTDAMESLFRAAIDIKGQAETFGYPIAGDIADSLCKLVEYGREGNTLPSALVDQHVQAVRAIVQERAKGDDSTVAKSLSKSLSDVTQDFLQKSA